MLGIEEGEMGAGVAGGWECGRHGVDAAVWGWKMKS